MDNGRQFGRDPFARFDYIEYRRKRTAHDPTCDWCGNGSARWVTTYQVSHDSGRTDDLRGQFCSRSCWRAYSGR